MQLVVHELDTALRQPVTPTKVTRVAAIRPHLYVHGSPAGSLTLNVLNASGDLVASSQPVLISNIPSTGYYHGYIAFDISCHMQANTEYNIELTGSGYSYADGAFVGWCNTFDFDGYPEGYTPTGDLTLPLDLQIWERTNK